MRILVIGAGATGGYFGGRLLEAGRDVTFLVRGAAVYRLKKDGLRIVSPHGNATLRPNVITTAQITGPYDLILLSVKSYGLAASLDDFARAVGPETMIMPFLNGMLHLDVLAARFGEKAVLGGVALIPAELGPEGEVIQLGPMQKLVYGDRPGKISDRIRALDATMQGANFEARASGEIMQEMWEKWVQLASIGSSNCLLRGSIGEIEAAGGAPLALTILAECSSIAAACGYPPRPFLTTQASAILAAAGSPLTASIYRDMSKGNRVEADHIMGDLLARGLAHGVETPLLHATYVSLSVYQSRLTA